MGQYPHEIHRQQQVGPAIPFKSNAFRS